MAKHLVSTARIPAFELVERRHTMPRLTVLDA